MARDTPGLLTYNISGAYCVPSKTTSLVYDKAGNSKKRERRKAAGCIDSQKPGNNRCSKGRPGAKPGYNCDEYPFASSKADAGASGGKEDRCSRCVPSSQNSKQGSVLSKGYKDFCKNKAPCPFQVFFSKTTANGAAHCSPGSPNNCAADGAEQCTGSINIIQRAEYTISPMDVSKRAIYTNGTYISGPAQFRTYGGQIVDAPYGGTIGQAVHAPRPIDQSLYDELIEKHVYDEDGYDDQFDEITANMVSDVDYLKEVVWEGQLKE
ncbi:hypothetical protein F4859DRAFT_528587 [Xylaria cf. heliscus]|nr:hypothetical protein F4859DRAFT_528587 [Xylaria cf. heliscus]